MTLLLIGCIGTNPDSSIDSPVDSDPGEGPDLSTLTRNGGCSDLVLTQGSEDDSLILIFAYTEGLAQQAFEAEDKTASATLDLASEGSLELWQGNRVTAIVCNDALDGSEVVETAWTVASGTAAISVVSDGTSEPWGEYPGDATVTLTDVVLESPDAPDISIPSRTWSAGVGWLPG